VPCLQVGPAELPVVLAGLARKRRRRAIPRLGRLEPLVGILDLAARPRHPSHPVPLLAAGIGPHPPLPAAAVPRRDPTVPGGGGHGGHGHLPGGFAASVARGDEEVYSAGARVEGVQSHADGSEVGVV
jgi:hypothetical protein